MREKEAAELQWNGYLCRELIEEVESKAGDVCLRVQQEHCNLTDLTFDLHNILQHQLSQNRDGSQPYRCALITQPYDKWVTILITRIQYIVQDISNPIKAITL